MFFDGAWAEWWAVVVHPFRYVRYARARRAFVERVEAAVVEEMERPRQYVYMGPVVRTEGGVAVDGRRLPLQ